MKNSQLIKSLSNKPHSWFLSSIIMNINLHNPIKGFYSVYYIVLMFLALSISLSAQKSLILEEYRGSEKTGSVQRSFQKIDNNTTNVVFTFERTAIPNPYEFDYTYSQVYKPDGTLELDITSVIDPTEMYIDKSLKLKSKSGVVVYPNELELNTKLQDTKGIITYAKDDGSFDMSYQVELTNRKVTNVSTQKINGKEIKTYSITYDYFFTKKVGENIVSTSKQNITELYASQYGIVNRSRSGNIDRMKNKNTTERSSKSSINSQTKLISIQ